MTGTFPDLCRSAMREIEEALMGVSESQLDRLASALTSARRIGLHGLGREGLQMKGLAMRLFHLGLEAHVLGEMNMPPLGQGDVLLVSAGPGDFATIQALTDIARKAGAQVHVVTAQAQSRIAREADGVLLIPAQTMANDQGAKTSTLPMGSLYEAAMMLVFELLVLRLRALTGETAATMRARHTNME